MYKLPNPDQSQEHTVVDMGDDHYTQGRPHPMIDSTLRGIRIFNEAQDQSVAVVLLDFILGYNSARNPVGDLLEAIQEAKKTASLRGGKLTFVSSICGTEGDLQDFALQNQRLQDAGVITFNTNASAVKFCREIITALN